ncbi:hypothetical protein [Sphingomonas endolithica]|uniref:hypothetical protein n=1 Tax=Sphingomonas endolithica TaxID=2972485 RepID=UPI0021B01A1A|nr:hypothetical protein [Sphingomonas sp. ZFBP2030]
MPRAFTRDQALQNAAFLAELRRTGNARDAARTLGAHRSTFTRRRNKHPAFAADWDAALAVAHAHLNPPPTGEGDHLPLPANGGGASPHTTRPAANEPRPTRTKSGRLQLRRAMPQRLTRADEQAFLAALSATANVRLSATAAGFSHSAFYHRRKQSPAFAREMRLALQQGYQRVEMALLASQEIESHADDAWRHNAPPDMPQMTVNQALQLLYLHQKEARSWAEPQHLKRRLGEPHEVRLYRLAIMAEARNEREREKYRIAEAARAAARVHPSPHEPPPPQLPALDQVTGWSKASGQAPYDESRALFGGWRLKRT